MHYAVNKSTKQWILRTTDDQAVVGISWLKDISGYNTNSSHIFTDGATTASHI